MNFKRRPKPRPVELPDGRVLDVKSGLEADLAKQIASRRIKVRYEEETFPYNVPARKSRYTPDFRLPNDIIIEGKGEFKASDRKKHLIFREQYPHLDIRFVFTNPNSRISKKSDTTYAAWCEQHGFKYAKGLAPDAWFMESK